MEWSYDFAVASLTILVVLQVFYLPHMRLPTRQNQLFRILLYAESITMLLSIGSTYINERWEIMPIPIFYFINITYMVSFFSCIYIEFQYILSELYLTMHGIVTKVFYLIPFVVVVGMCVSSPFTGCVFWFSPTEGYVNGPAYNLLYAVGLYYFCLATFNLIVHWRYTDSLIKRTLLSYCLIIFSGFGLHYLFHKTMIVYLSTLVATLIVYLSLQSPSLYINSRTHCFNHRALADLIDDCQLEGKWHCQIVISLNNYTSLRVIYGDAEISKALANVSLFYRLEAEDRM